jgi:hypothetical protein
VLRASVDPTEALERTFRQGFVWSVNRGDWTPLELFLAGIRALTLQLSIGDIEAACGEGNDKNGYGGLESFGCAVALLSLGTELVRDELDVERSHLCLENVGFDRGV